MEIVDFLCKEFNISRLTLGIAGLKDKDAITRQRISIYKSALHKLWGENAFLDALSQYARIIKTDRNDKPIGISSGITNTFQIRLRATKKLSQAERIKTDHIISQLFTEGIPNVFGTQRFGIESRNRKMGKQILNGELKIKEKFEAKFKLQAYASRLFNEYIAWRTTKEPALLDGDILQLDEKWSKTLYIYDKAKNTLQEIQEKGKGKDVFCHPQTSGTSIPYTEESKAEVTWPIIGFNLLMPAPSTQSGQKEVKFLESHGVNKNKLKPFNDYKIFGIRRKIRIRPQKAKYSFDADDLVIRFTLGAGEYASILIDDLLRKLG